MKWYDKPILLGISISGWLFIVATLAAYVFIRKEVISSYWGF